MDDTTLAYLAGLFDGEGSVQIGKSKYKEQARYSLIVCIVNLDPTPLRLAQGIFGGSLYKKPEITKLRGTYVWTINSQKAISFLKSIEPYSIIKLEQIKLAIVYQARVESNNVKNLTKDELAAREGMYLTMKALKKIPYG